MKLKRAGAVILSLLILAACCTACKPDNIAPPTEILDPAAQPSVQIPAQTPDENNVTPAPVAPEPEVKENEEPAPAEEPGTDVEAGPENQTGEAPQENPEEPNGAGDTEKTEKTEETEEKEETPPFQPVALPANPLTQADFSFSQTEEASLPVSGFIKNAAAVSFEKTVFRIITASETPAFQYMDNRGKPVTEWDWLQQICEKHGAKLKYTVKNASLSVKAQRVALYAGLPLSLVQLDASDLGAGLTLIAKVPESELDPSKASFGINKAVLAQSNNRLLAPRGAFSSFWYDITELTGDLEPRKNAETGDWTLEHYTTAYNDAVRRGLQPLALKEPLVWAMVGGISPLTLLNDKLDHNIHARVVREVWTALRTMNTALSPFSPDQKVLYSMDEGTIALEYTDLPVAGKNQKLQWIGLPALAKDGENPVSFSGTFFALPRYGLTEEQRLASLVLAELWCNRYTEARAAALAKLGVSGAAYAEYASYGEAHGYLILHNRTIEKLAEPYLAGLTDQTVDMEAVWTATCKKPIDSYIETQNLYY